MRLVRVPMALLVSLLLAATLVAAAPAAGAAPTVSYAGGCIIRLSQITAVPNDKLTVTATGYPTGAVVTFTLDPDTHPVKLGTVTADSSGTAVLVFSLPPDTKPGVHIVTATGVPAGQCSPSVSTNVTVSALVVNTTVAQPGSLPRTGSDSAELVQLALILIAIGGLVTLAARKRASRAHVES